MSITKFDINNKAQIKASYDLLKHHCGFVIHNHLGALKFKGKDVKSWLQGQVTNDLNGIRQGDIIHFCFCSPTGQIEAICSGSNLGENFIIITDTISIPSILERCAKFIILEDVQVEHLKGTVLGIYGPESEEQLDEFLGQSLGSCHTYVLNDYKFLCFPSQRLDELGWEIFLPEDSLSLLSLFKKSFELIDSEFFEILRLESGTPHFGKDTDAKTLPPEMGEQFEKKHISFTKGCYSGQEILMRIFSRGHTNKTWIGLFSEDLLQEGAEIRDIETDEIIGKVTTALWNPKLGNIASAFLKNEFYILNSKKSKIKVKVGDMSCNVQITQWPLHILNNLEEKFSV